MKKIILISLFGLMSFSFTQDIYPFFSDPLKQLEFEEKRIYVKEESGERTLISGGDSYTALANPLGTIFLEQDPDYIAKNNPIKTEIEYWYNFEIKQNNNLLTEIEFLTIIGLEDKANIIISDFQKLMNEYNNSIDGEYVEIFKKNEMRAFWFNYAAVSAGCGLLFIDIIPKPFFVLSGLGILVGLTQEKGHDDLRLVYTNPEIAGTIPKPILKQILSPEQITSLADSYNRKIYNEIANGLPE